MPYQGLRFQVARQVQGKPSVEFFLGKLRGFWVSLLSGRRRGGDHKAPDAAAAAPGGACPPLLFGSVSHFTAEPGLLVGDAGRNLGVPVFFGFEATFFTHKGKPKGTPYLDTPLCLLPLWKWSDPQRFVGHAVVGTRSRWELYQIPYRGPCSWVLRLRCSFFLGGGWPLLVPSNGGVLRGCALP